MTKVFDIVSEIGRRQTDRRAPARPTMSDSLDEFFAGLEEHAAHRPDWYDAYLRVHWWLEKYGVRATRTRVRGFWQRGRRGWADTDTWGLDNYLAGVIAESVAHLRATTHGYPADLDAETWDKILEQIVDGMNAWERITILDYADEELPVLEGRFKLAMDYLASWWGHLWD